ncbi:MAG: CehA/McbA family metallohydrolase [Cephaloticoccus sp.]|nr:CehA/McbA family metallohydrolase [Cephaloticoccus sp.]
MKIANPYLNAPAGAWLRGNLHTHTTASDGAQPIQKVVADYTALGYDFLSISDHDIFTGEADYAKLDGHGLVLIPGNEVTRNGQHLLHVGADRLLEPHADRQQVIEEINASTGFAVINHPNWLVDFNHCPFPLLDQWQGYVGMEIYNGTIGRLDGSPYATDKWDRLLVQGRRVWGFANDDSHLPGADIGLGWNMVGTADRSVSGILDALRRGCFYGSTGVTITSISVNGNRIRVETAGADRIIAYQQVGREFANVEGASLEVEVPANARYVRFECLGRGGRAAWTQPFFIESE